jgi:hypothetical protein
MEKIEYIKVMGIGFEGLSEIGNYIVIWNESNDTKKLDKKEKKFVSLNEAKIFFESLCYDKAILNENMPEDNNVLDCYVKTKC